MTTYENRAAWEAVTGPYSTITFTELPPLTWLSDQYAPLGVRFTDGSDQIIHNVNIFSDNRGLNGAFDESTLEFDTPMTTLAMDFPGHLHVKLYNEGTLIFSSFEFGQSGTGNFAGLISTQPFDEAFIYDPGGGLFVDNLYFGPPVPGPGALMALAISATLLPGRRRRAR